MHSLDQLYIYCRDQNIPCMSHATRAWLEDFLLQHKPKNIVEIGAAAGYSSLVMASITQSWWWTIISSEISRPQYKKCLFHQKEFHQYRGLHYYHIDATQSHQLRKIIPDTVSFAFVDGMKADYITFVQQLIPYMSAGNSYIVCDDVIQYHNKIWPLYDYLSQMQIQYQTIPLDDDDGILLISL